MPLTREQFAAAMARRFETIEVPFLGAVRIQSLTAREMRDVRQSFITQAGEVDKDRYAKRDAIIVAAAIVDDAGQRIISDDDAMRGFFDPLDGGPWAVLTAAVKRHTGWDCGEDWEPVRAALKN